MKMNESKCLEYYLDSRMYNQEEVKKNIDEMKKEFSNKKITVNVTINQFGMYVITFCFENKNTMFNRIKIYLKKKREKRLMLQEKNYDERSQIWRI